MPESGVRGEATAHLDNHHPKINAYRDISLTLLFFPPYFCCIVENCFHINYLMSMTILLGDRLYINCANGTG